MNQRFVIGGMAVLVVLFLALVWRDAVRTSSSTPQSPSISHGTATPPASADVRIFVLDASYRIVRLDDMQGANWTTLVSSGTDTIQFRDLKGIAAGPGGKIYVTDNADHCVVSMSDGNGAGLAIGGRRDSLVDSLNVLSHIAVDQQEKIYVTDLHGSIARMDDWSGVDNKILGSQGSGSNQFNNPMGIAVDTSGKIYVADNGNKRIVRIDDITGAGWTTFTGSGTAIGRIQPESIAVDRNNAIYFTDHFDKRIIRINDMAGEGWAALTFDTSSFYHPFPNAIAVGPDGKIYMTDTDSSGGEITRIDNMTGANYISYRGSPSTTSALSQFVNPIGIAVVPR